jgi:hypothetical protein
VLEGLHLLGVVLNSNLDAVSILTGSEMDVMKVQIMDQFAAGLVTGLKDDVQQNSNVRS